VEQCSRSGRPLPRRQDLPPEALWSPEALISRYEDPRAGRRPPNLIVVSYCWHTREHPDPRGDQMRMLGRILSWSHACPFRSKETAVFLDWCSLYQNPRTDREAEVFRAAMKRYMNIWYAHSKTDVLMLTDVPSDVEVNRPYHERGWPTFESRVSGLISQFRVSGYTGVYDLGKLASSQLKAECTAESWRGMHRACVKGFSPPVTPEVFNDILEQKIFTNPAHDSDFCKRKYAEVFEETTADATELLYQGLEWSDKEVEELVDIFPGCRSLLMLNMRDNLIGDGGAECLSRALPSTLRHLSLRDNRIGDSGVEELARELRSGRCPSLRVVNLSGNAIGDEGLGELANAIAGLEGLQYLYVSHNCFHDTGVLKLAGVLPKCEQLQRLDLQGNAVQASTADTMRWAWLRQGRVQEKLILTTADQSSRETSGLESTEERVPLSKVRSAISLAVQAQRTFLQETKSLSSFDSMKLGSTLQKAFHSSLVESMDVGQAVQHISRKLRDSTDIEGQIEAARSVQLLARRPEAQECLANAQILPCLMQLLLSVITPLRAAAACAVRGLVTGHSEIRQMAIRDGAVAVLVKQLDSANTELQENSALALWSLSSGYTHVEFLSANAIPPIVGLLASRSSVVQKASVGTILNLAQDVKAHASLISSGAVGALIELLRSEECRVKEVALGALRRLVESNKHKEPLEPLFIAADAFPVLLEHLASDAPREQDAAARILRGLTRRCAHSRKKAVAHGALRATALLALLDSSAPNLPLVAMDVLWNLTQDATAMVHLLSSTVPRLLLGLRFREPPLRAEAARVLQQMVDDEENRDEAVEHGAVESTVDMLGSIRDDLQLAASGLLRVLSLHPDAKVIALQAGAVQILTDLLCSGNVQLQDVAARSLRNLATNHDIKASAGKAGAIPILAGLLDSPSPEVQEAAAGALRNLVYRNGDNKQIAAHANCLPRLVTLLQSPFQAVQLQVLSALVNLVSFAGDVELAKYIRQEAVDAGAPRGVEPLLAHPEQRLRQQAGSVLSVLSSAARSTHHLPPVPCTSPWTTTRTRKAGSLGSPPERTTVHVPRHRAVLGV